MTNTNDKLIALALAVMVLPALLLSAVRGGWHSLVSWASDHQVLTHPYLLPVPATGGLGLGRDQLILTIGALGLLGVITQLLIRSTARARSRSHG